jgi:DNA polymerase-4
VSGRRILHVDMDAFFASVELLRHPELAGRPVVVGGGGDRGVVAAASYEARVFGVRSAMATARARRLCPDLVVVPPDHAHYAGISARIMACCSEFTPLVEPLALDEAFLDVSGAGRLFGTDRELATELRRRLHEREGLWSSVGVASTKLVAKLASEAAKPLPGSDAPQDGVCVVEPADELRFLQDRPAADLWGVGPVTGDRLRALGVDTVADLAAFPLDALVSHLGPAVGRQLHDLANGRDDRPVVADLEVKSISQEETFARDRTSLSELDPELVRMAERVARRARRRDLEGRTVHLKLRWADFVTTTRSRTLDEPTADGLVVARTARELLQGLPVERGVRLLGVGISALVPAGGATQLRLDLGGSASQSADRSAALRAADRVRERFGESAIAPVVPPPTDPRG